MAVGISQKKNVDDTVRRVSIQCRTFLFNLKEGCCRMFCFLIDTTLVVIFECFISQFLLGNCSIILFHYDGNTDGWRDLEWNDKALHIVARNQTKWYELFFFLFYEKCN